MRRKIGLVIIHNNEYHLPAHLTLEKIKSIAIKSNFEVLSTNFFNQSEIIRQTPNLKITISLIARNVRQRKLEFVWFYYLKNKNPFKFLFSIIGLIKFIFKLLARNYRKRYYVAMQIENELAKKHHRAAHWALINKLDFLVVLEADATWINGESSLSMDRLFNYLRTMSPKNFLYFDLAGGNSLVNLGADSVKSVRISENLFEFEKPFTNGTGAYLVSKSVIEIFGDIENLKFAEKYPADWVINFLFYNFRDIVRTRGFHFNPPALLHGSVNSSIKSWHPDRKFN